MRAVVSSGMMLGIQLLVVAFGLAAVALYPPQRGKMMLVPLWPGAGEGLHARAIEGGAQLVDRGPLPGSLVISGIRSTLAPAMLVHGILIVTAPVSGCGESA